MNASFVLKQARDAGIHLVANGDRLSLESAAPPSVEVLELLAKHKAGILELIRRRSAGWSS